MTPRPNVSEERKKQILEAALKVFSRQGIYEARMDDIVSEAGLSKGTLYWYFNSKDEIVIAILESIFENELEKLQTLQDSEGGAQERLISFLDHTMGDIKEMLSVLPITYEFYALAFRERKVRLALQHYLRRYVEAVVPIIEQGISTGEFEEVNPHEAALAIGAIIEGSILLWVYDPEMINLEQNMRSSLMLLLKGLRCPQ